MLKLYMVAVVKDIVMNLLIIFCFFRQSLELTAQQNFTLNFIIKIVGFFTEDTAQSVVQYFYFEKYQMDGDVIIIFKFVIGLLVTGKSLLTLALAYNQAKNDMKKIDYITAFVYILLVLVPVFRLVGLMVQANKRGSMIRAGCLEYRLGFSDNLNIRQKDQYEIDYQHNYQWDIFYLMGRDEGKFFNENSADFKRLYVTPFTSQCMTVNDYMYLTGTFPYYLFLMSF